MPDRIFSEQKLADLYDLFSPWGGRSGDDEFYNELIMAADSVLDVGCGTGMLLRKAREFGHTGRLVGLDPAQAMLEVGRRDRSDIEWIHGDLSTVSFEQEFELIIMTGHAFQVLLTDDDLRQSLTAARSALTDTGRFAFETRNPNARRWEGWVPENAVEIPHPDGGVARMEHDVDLPVEGEYVSFTTRLRRLMGSKRAGARYDFWISGRSMRFLTKRISRSSISMDSGTGARPATPARRS